VFTTALLLSGACLGYFLAGDEKLPPYKPLSFIGITHGFLGIVVLAEFVAKRESLKSFVVKSKSNFSPIRLYLLLRPIPCSAHSLFTPPVRLSQS
jgi:hypothetical protein